MKIREVKIKKDKKNDITKSGYFNVFGEIIFLKSLKKLKILLKNKKETFVSFLVICYK